MNKEIRFRVIEGSDYLIDKFCYTLQEANYKFDKFKLEYFEVKQIIIKNGEKSLILKEEKSIAHFNELMEMNE